MPSAELPPNAHHPQKPDAPRVGAGPNGQELWLLHVPEKPACHCVLLP
jgi:hypothetical protein